MGRIACLGLLCQLQQQHLLLLPPLLSPRGSAEGLPVLLRSDAAAAAARGGDGGQQQQQRLLLLLLLQLAALLEAEWGLRVPLSTEYCLLF